MLTNNIDQQCTSIFISLIEFESSSYIVMEKTHNLIRVSGIGKYLRYPTIYGNKQRTTMNKQIITMATNEYMH